MTHFLIDINIDFLSEVSNIIFIRHPEEIIDSYSKVIPNPKLEDIGIKQQYELYLLLEKKGKTPIVLDSECLLRSPKSMLNKLCVILDIPFDKEIRCASRVPIQHIHNRRRWTDLTTLSGVALKEVGGKLNIE